MRRRGRRALPLALEDADGVIGQLQLIAAPRAHPERAVAAAVRPRRAAHLRAQDLERRGELVVAIGAPDCPARDARLEPVRNALALDAVGAPGVGPAAVLGEAAGEPGVVEVL